MAHKRVYIHPHSKGTKMTTKENNISSEIDTEKGFQKPSVATEASEERQDCYDKYCLPCGSSDGAGLELARLRVELDPKLQ